MPLRKGQNVLLKVVKARGVIQDDGRVDAARPDGGTLFQVYLPEQTIHVREENLLAAPDLHDRAPRGSNEWSAEFGGFIELARKVQRTPVIALHFEASCASGLRLGFLIPIAPTV